MFILFTNLSDGLTINSSDWFKISHNWSLGAKLTADSAINKVIRELEVIGEPAKYLVQVIADMNLPFQDSVTGNQKVTVSVSAQIRDVSQKRAKNVAAFTEQASGTGQDGKTAALNAMKNAATIVDEGIVDQLNAKGIN